MSSLTTNVDEKMLRKTKFPQEFSKKVDMNKVQKGLIKGWIHREIARIQQSDDDVVAELVSTLLESERFPNIKKLQISLTGFLDKEAATFCETLWKLCLSAQDNASGVPTELIEAKKAELSQKEDEEKKAREEATKRQEAERERERELDRMRDRERNDRRGRGGRNGRDYDRRRFRDSRSRSRSPAFRRRRDDDDFDRQRPRADTYVPSRRSPSYGRDASRSRSPPARRRRRDSTRSRSRSPPPRRRRRNTSSERSSSPQPRRENYGRRRRSPSPRRRSPPPPKRARRSSPSPSRRPSTSESKSSAQSGASQPQPNNRRRSDLAPDDLMSAGRRSGPSHQDNLRLRRESSTPNPTDGEQAPSNQQPLQPTSANLAREAMLKNMLIQRRQSGQSESSPKSK